ncbi:hypothetical protein LTR95_007309 [Oleoguttula sp. CCFEE 5521]
MATNLVYRFLAANDFRLLHVSPGEGVQQIHARLSHATVSDDQRLTYETISYAWGDPTPVAEALVNGLPVLIPANTEEVLKRVRLHDRERIIWIDAVCINQIDLHERSAQIVLMGSIYAGSLRNLVFLGELDENMAIRVLGLIEAINQDARLETNDFESLDATLSDNVVSEKRSMTRFAFEVDLEAELSLLELPLLRRLWVLQELVLAPQSVALLGSIELELSDVLLAIRWIKYKQWNLPLPSVALAGRNCGQFLFDFVDRVHGYYAGSRIGLDHLMQCGRIFEKTEPRDGVYAVLGLLPQDQVFDLRPDYTKPLAEVLVSATRSAIDNSQNLELFREIAHREDDLEYGNIPSWAVRVDREFNFLVDGEHLPGYHRLPESSRDVQSIEWERADPMILPVQGITVGNVVEVTAPLQHNRAQRVSADQLNRFCMSLKACCEAAARDCSLEVSLRGLAEVLIAGTSIDGSRADTSAIDAAEELIAYLGEPREPTESSHALRKARVRCEFGSAINRRMFITEDGKPGLGPRVMRQGDLVAVLRGASFPAILRCDPQGRHQLVGEAYLHGIMDGEAEAMLDAMRGRETTFELR